MLTLQNGEQKYSITFQHYPTKQERDEYRERCAKALAEGKPKPHPPRQHRKTACRVWELADNPEGTPRMVNSTLLAEGVVRQYPFDEYSREIARRQSLMKALHLAFPGAESENPANRQLRIQAWELYWQNRNDALNGNLPSLNLLQFVHTLHDFFNGNDGQREAAKEQTEVLFHILHGTTKENDNDSQS